MRLQIQLKHGFLAFLFYSFALAFMKSFYISFLLPPLFLTILNYRAIFIILRQLLFLNIFVFIIFIGLIYSNDTNLAYLILFKSNAIMFFGLCLFYKSNPFEIALMLQELKFPPKFVNMLFFVAKFITIFKLEILRFNKALKARGFINKTSFFAYKTYANFIGFLFITAFNRSNILQKAMISRGFNGKIYNLKDKASYIYMSEIVFLALVLFIFIKPLGKII